MQALAGRPGTPLRSAGVAPTSAVQGAFSHPAEQEKRGKKRERDDVGVGDIGVGVAEGINGVVGVNNRANMNPAKAIISAKAGMAGIRPRPIKKLRMVSVALPWALHFLFSHLQLVSFCLLTSASRPGYPRTVKGCSCDAAAYSPGRVSLPPPQQPLASTRSMGRVVWIHH